MIPYVTLPTVDLWGLELRPFFVLVVLGIVVGVLVYDRICRKGGVIDPKVALHLPELCLLGGFVGAHLVHVLFYHPELMNDDPWVLFKIWGGFSSIGGFLGGSVAGVVYLLLKKQGIRAYGDRMLFSLCIGWIFGRTGCAVTHDHPGKLSDFPLAVAFPGGARHDLGLYELLLTLCIVAVLMVLASKPRRAGSFMAAILLIYSPVRFLFDFLRAEDGRLADSRYFGLTPAQYGMILLFISAIYLWTTASKQPLDVAYRPWEKNARNKEEPHELSDHTGGAAQ